MRLILFVLLIIITQARSAPCFSSCRFTLCDKSEALLVTEPDTPHRAHLCLGDANVGLVNTGEASVVLGGYPTPLSLWKPAALPQRFSKSFFKAFPTSRGSAIGHETPQQNQLHFATGKCFALPVVAYQLLGPRGDVVRNVQNDRRPLIDCVAFTLLAQLGAHTSATPSPSHKPELSPPPSKTAVSVRRVPSKPPPPSPSVTIERPWSGPTLKEPVLPGKASTAQKETFMKELVLGVTSSVTEDLYLLVDGTESMRVAISTVRQQIGEIISARVKGSGDAAFGIGYFRDEDEMERGFGNVQNITRNATAVFNAAAKLVAAGGGDAPEGGLQALYRIAQNEVGWRNGSRRIIAMFGDRPQHEPSCVRGNRLNRDNVVKALVAKGIKVIMVDLSGQGPNGGLNGQPTEFRCPNNATAGGLGQGREIAERTGGAFLENPHQDEVVEEIVRALGALDLLVDADLSDCHNMYDISLTPKLPIRINQGDSLYIKETIVVHPRICESKRGFQCTIRFTADGGDLTTETIGSTNIRNCFTTHTALPAS